MPEKRSILNHTLEEIEEQFTGRGLPKFRAKQIFEWIYQKFVFDFNQMTNLPKDLSKDLLKQFSIIDLDVEKIQISKKDQTTKFLLKTYDGHYIESVLMFFHKRISICISTQVGCAVGCAFCASGLKGVIRGLTPSEIISQVLIISEYLNKQQSRLTNIVVMGVGEPFLNYDHLIQSLDRINDKRAFGLSARKIVVSTSGIIPKIKKFMAYNKQVKLSVSLHSPFDEVRNWLVPINKKYPIKELMNALKDYTMTKGKLITIEYILIDGVNAGENDARELVKLLSQFDIKVNLIPYNPVSQFDFKPATKSQSRIFQDYLLSHNIKATIRQEKGQDIDAACGQLRLNRTTKTPNK